MRKGYKAEYSTKNELVKEYGKQNVVKIAIGQFGADFLVFKSGTLLKIVEVKETKKKKYYPSQREKEQLRRILEFADEQGCDVELWIYKHSGKGKKREKVVLKYGGVWRLIR